MGVTPEFREGSSRWGASCNLEDEEVEPGQTEGQAGFGESVSTWSSLSDDKDLH